jgi:surface antigen
MRRSRILISLGAFLLIAGVCPRSQAANICIETVAANRTVDGIPAYAQCTATTSSAIYSNNGVDTSTTSGGTDWVRTQMSGGYQCTELAHRYLYFKWNVKSVPNGNAGTWCDGTIPAGLEKATTPMHGDLIVFAPGSCGADATTGHVAVIDVVNTNATVTFVEQNSAGRRSCANSTAACFLHATANTGVPLDGGSPDSPSADSAVASIADASTRSDATVDRGRADTSSLGGATGSGGASGTGGAAGTGGAGATVASSGGTTGSTTNSTAPTASSSSGCSCRLANRRLAQEGSDGSAAVVVLALGAGLAISRRRASRKRPRT